MEINSDVGKVSLTRAHQKATNFRGFTLVELLMVIALIGILATLAIVNITEFKNSARISRCAGELRGLEKDIISFATEKGDYPTDLTVLASSIVSDPWGRPYVYKKTADMLRTWIGEPLNSDFDLYSIGIDHLTADEITDADALDDIIRANDGAFCGSSKKFALP